MKVSELNALWSSEVPVYADTYNSLAREDR